MANERPKQKQKDYANELEIEVSGELPEDYQQYVDFENG
jgi:hypothetical protein